MLRDAIAGSTFANLALQLVRASKGQCTGKVWDDWLCQRIGVMADGLYEHGATEQEVDLWLACLSDSYVMAMEAALQALNDQVLEPFVQRHGQQLEDEAGLVGLQ